MNDIRELLTELQQRGIRLTLDGDSLRSRSAPGAIDADIAARLRACKHGIIEYLRAHGSDGGSQERGPVPVPRDQPLPLSSTQRGLWFIDQLGGSAQYILACAPILLREAVDRVALQGALDTIVARHESLRTVFVNVDGEPRQRILEPRALAIVEHDLSAVAEQDQPAAIDRLDREHALRPFDLERDLMLRVALLRLAEQRWVVLVAMHHIASDGWSIGVFQREFAKLYHAASRGRHDALPPLPLQYADYASWQAARLSEPGARERLQHCCRRLQGAAPVHSLPLDHPRPQKRSGVEAGLLVQCVDPALADRLKQRARAADATLFMVLHAALCLVFARWGRTDDVVVGMPVSGRAQQALAPLIGFFANTLALRVEVDPALELDAFLRHVRERCLEAYEHQDVPFDSIVEALNPERNMGYTSVVQLMFSLLQIDDSMLSESLNIELLPARQARLMFDLDVMAVEDAQGLSLRWTYDRALFAEATVRGIMETMTLALAQLADAGAGTTRIADLDMLGDAGRARLRAWNATARDYPRETCLHALIEAQAARDPQRIALVCADRALRYAEVNGKANALARELIALGVGPGDIVSVIMRPGIEVPLSFLAVMKTGAAFAPLDIDWPMQRLDMALQNLGDAPILITAPLRTGRRTHVVDPDRLGLEANLELPQSADSPIYAVHTSGSTGTPKAALNSHRGIVNRLCFMSRYFGDADDEVVLQTTDHCFDSAIWQFFWPMTKGGVSVLPQLGDGFDLGQIAATLGEHRVTLTDFSPALLSVFLEHVAETGSVYPHLRELIVGGEEMTPTLAARCARTLPGVRIHNFYGPSEASIGAICHALVGTPDGAVPIGKPIDNVVVALVDQALRPVPIGTPGEILLGGDCVGIGYVGDPETTARNFVAPDPPLPGSARFYRTGDLGRYREDGRIEFLGRMDSQVKIRGFRVDLGEVVIALEAQPHVRQACVRVDGEGVGKRLLAWLVLDRGADTSDARIVEAIRTGLAERLPGHMLPSSLLVVERMPMTPGGKIDARALPTHAERSEDVGYVAPCTPEEIALARIWSALFDVAADDPVGVDDDFFERGGHSLLATQLAARVRSGLRVELPLQVLFAHSRLRDLAQWCATQPRLDADAATAKGLVGSSVRTEQS